MQVLAGLIPLFGAVVAVFLVGQGDQRTFQSLIAGLILLGIFGYQMTNAVTRSLSQVVVTLTGDKG